MKKRDFFFSLFSLKIPLFKSFFRDVAVLFSYKRAGGKVVFFHFVQGVRVQKKASCRGDPQHKASLFTMIFFLFFSPVISDPDAQRECHFEDQREWEGT